MPPAPLRKASMARTSVEVRETLSGKIWAVYKGRRIEMAEIERPERATPQKAAKSKTGEVRENSQARPESPLETLFQEKRSPELGAG